MSSKLFHVLLFKFPKESETIAHTAGDALQDLRTVIPEIQSISFGSTQDNLYEGFRPRLKGYTHAAVLVFNSAEALKTYNFHPAHQKFVAEHVKPYLDPAEDMIVLEMMKVWNKYNPNYLTQDELDYSACLEMAYKIAKVKGWKKQTVLYEKQNDCVASWEKIVLFIRSDSFLKKLAVQNINNQFQMVIQKMTNPDEVKEVAKTERQNPTIKPVTEEMLAKYR